MMRVGYLTFGLDRAPDGVGRYTVELLRALAALPGAPEIVLLTTERDDPYGLWRSFERHALPGCHTRSAALTAGNALLAAAARRHRLDIIHDPTGMAPFLGPPAGARRLATIHDAFGYAHPEANGRLASLRLRWLLPRAARAADAVLTGSNHARAELVRFLGLPEWRVRAINLGVDARFAPAPDGSVRRAVLAHYGIHWPYLLYVGGLEPRKNLARLVEAFATLRVRYPQLRLVLAGARRQIGSEADAAVERLGLEGRVRVIGQVDDADLPALYSAAELFVFPSLYEGFGLPPLEAMACGTPVVAARAGSLPEVLGEAALLVDPYDVGGLASAIERALADRSLAADLRRRGRQRAALFTWRRAAYETLAIYQRVGGAGAALEAREVGRMP